MKNMLRQNRLSGYLLMLFIFFSMFFPSIYSAVLSPTAPDFILVNLVAVLYIAAAVSQRQLQIGKERILLPLLSFLLICFNICSFYINWTYQSWYWGQINVSISFLLFLTLIASNAQEENSRTINVLILLCVISNVIGFIPYFMNYYGVSYINGHLGLMHMDGQFDERRYHWFYYHKSEYSFMLILFLALIVTYRKRFPNKWIYYGSAGVMVLGLIISNTRASMVACLAIFAGLILDEIRRKPKHIRKWYIAGLAVLFVIMLGLLYVISQRRNLLTLGSRTHIWAAAVQEILKNPYGLGQECGLVSFPIPVWPKNVFNGHNVFLNILMQFSISAGSFFLLMLAVIIVTSIKRKPCFLTLGIWAALLVPMNMDWCLLLPQLSIFLMVVYFLFFYQEKRKTPEDALF